MRQSIGLSSRSSSSLPLPDISLIALNLYDSADLQIRNEMAVNFDLNTARIMLVLGLQILERPFFSVPLRDTLNLNCWLVTILPPSMGVRGIQLMQHVISVENLSLNISCISCTSPNFDDLLYQLYSPADDVGDVTAKVFNFVNLLLESDYLTEGLLSDAAKQCPHNTEYDPTATYGNFFETGGGFEPVEPARDKRAVYFDVANAIVAACLILLFATMKSIVKRRNQAWTDSLPSDAVFRLRQHEAEEQKKETDLNESTRSMFRSPHLPCYVRILVPIVLVLTIGLYLCGHLGVLSTVNLEGQIAGEAFAVNEFLSFSFIRSTSRTYNNGGSEMSILLFIFTGVWPYIKLFMSLALWFIPPQNLSVSRRGSMFLWLDVLAKLSIVDIFMTVIAIAACLVYIGGRESEGLTMEGNFYSLRLIVVPGISVYSLLMAQRLSRVSSRYLLDCQHQIVDSANSERSQRMRCPKLSRTESWYGEDEDEDGHIKSQRIGNAGQFEDDCTGVDSRKSESTLGHGIEDEEGQNGNRAERAGNGLSQKHVDQFGKRLTANGGTIAVAFAGLTVIILGVIGIVLGPAIYLDTTTVWGILESGSTFEQAVTNYSVFRVVTSILLQASFVLDSVSDYVGLGLLLTLAIISAIAFPSIKAVLFCLRWHRQRKNQANTVTGAREDKRISAVLISAVMLPISSFGRWLDKRKSQVKTPCSERGEDLTPAYRVKAWQHLEVYIIAFVIACWQLGAVAAYAIHSYCYILERLYDTLVYLGVYEKTSAQCFRVQASSPSTLLILCSAFLVLLASFLVQAISQYRRVMASAAKLVKEDEYEADFCRKEKSDSDQGDITVETEASSGRDESENELTRSASF